MFAFGYRLFINSCEQVSKKVFSVNKHKHCSILQCRTITKHPPVYLKNRNRQSSSFTMAQEKNKESVFRFSDYDCIGFDLDNTLARYRIGAMIEMEYEIMAKYLVEKKGYPKDNLYKPFDHNFILRGLIVDDENGNILRIGPDGSILQASHGTMMLKEEDIEKYYPNRHWEPVDMFAKDPLVTWNGPYSQKMRTLLDYYDIASSLIFARAVDTVDQQKGQKQEKYYIWPDLFESHQFMFDRENFQSGEGFYFKEMKNNPEKYYYKCSEQLLDWLRNFRQQGKMLFLITGSHVDFATHTATNTLGPNWRDLFDIVICYSKKPGFFTMRRDFMELDGITETRLVSLDDLKLGGIYTQGNWTDLHEFFRRHINKENQKFLYVGDNLIQDIFTPNTYSHCETVCVCEELEAEGMHGHQQWHPDQQFLMSTVWGSYFHCNNKDTNWYDIMRNHSRLCVPSVEYVACLPPDHQFESN